MAGKADRKIMESNNGRVNLEGHTYTKKEDLQMGYQPKQYKFDLGDWVEARAAVVFHYKEKLPRIDLFKSNRIRHRYEFDPKYRKQGRIVGIIMRGEGELTDYGSHDIEFVTTKKVVLYKVTQGMTNIPFEVLEKDLELIAPPHRFPFLSMGQPPQS